MLPAVLRYTLYFWYSVTELHIWTLYLGYRVYLGYSGWGEPVTSAPRNLGRLDYAGVG
ncbi:Uncharacterised protein [Mycobacteroides abscessus subsp. abscessus]|nr:Uncharacterised protein [Mycobacteroides abscessus subsp. abscessus]SIN50362.1 Uncharacterised protein [Mycobacteroides abscessus subsp. bolletii]